MTSERDLEKLKTHFKDYLEETGRNTRKPFSCINPNHEDTNPSMSYDPRRNMLHCFSCNTNYDLISLYALDNGLDEKKDFKRIVEDLKGRYNVSFSDYSDTIKKSEKSKKVEQKKEDYSRYYEKCKKDIDKTTYLKEKRGISQRLIDKYNIGYDADKHLVIFPCSNNYYEARSTLENTSFRFSKPKGATTELFNLDNIKNNTYKGVVFVTESVIDALSLEETIEDIKTLSLNSVSNTSLLLDAIEKNNFKGAIVMMLDADETGIRASRELKAELDKMNIKNLVMNRDESSYKGTKDINEYLLQSKEDLEKSIRYVKETLEEMMKREALKILDEDNALKYLDIFNNNIKDADKNKPISTGIKRLDEALDGGLYRKNLVILGAISSLGKTTLALQIADNVASEGEDVLIFSLEMSKEELIAKSLSRKMYQKAYEGHYTALALSTRDILKGKMINDRTTSDAKQQKQFYADAYKEYAEQIAPNLYITECNEETEINIKTIEKRIKRQIEITDKKPLVIIDYLQIIKNEERGLTDKQAVDRLVTDLKRIARDNDITIVLISAFNRTSYNTESNLASFRDTSTIEYTADVLLALQLETLDGVQEADKKKSVNEEQQKDVRALTLKVLKQRLGRITDVKHIDFYAKNNYMHFKEYDEDYNAF